MLKKVYLNQNLLYDFGLKLNDTFFCSGVPAVISSIDSVLIWNEFKKRYNFEIENTTGNPVFDSNMQFFCGRRNWMHKKFI